MWLQCCSFHSLENFLIVRLKFLMLTSHVSLLLHKKLSGFATPGHSGRPSLPITTWWPVLTFPSLGIMHISNFSFFFFLLFSHLIIYDFSKYGRNLLNSNMSRINKGCPAVGRQLDVGAKSAVIDARLPGPCFPAVWPCTSCPTCQPVSSSVI